MAMAMTKKVVMMGEGGVGKSSVTIRYTQNQFVSRYDPTIEDIYVCNTFFAGMPKVLEILDTAGQENYKALRDSYVKDGHGFVIVYDVTRMASFEQLDAFVKLVMRSKEEHSDTPIVIAGNKCDLTESISVPFSQVEAWVEATRANNEAKGIKMRLHHLTCSAKTGHNVRELYDKLLEMMDAFDKQHPANKKPKTMMRCEL
jgi:small GTP-binding protein